VKTNRSFEKCARISVLCNFNVEARASQLKRLAPMFDRNDFNHLAKIEGERLQFLSAYRGLHYTCYPQHAFNVPDAEEFIRITRAPKAIGDNGLYFWLSAELTNSWKGRESYLLPFLSGAYFEPISEAGFNGLVADTCASLIKPPDLPLIRKQRFIGALLMYSMKTEFWVSAVAEYENEYIHFAWETTA
jgi:hypothetical protein